MVGDKISNLIISLKNSSMVGKETVTVSGSKLYESILAVLKDKNFIESFEADKKTGDLIIVLKYDENGNSVINDVKRVSKLSQRIYKGYKELFPIKNGYGMSVISTPAGIVSDEAAREQKVGGEVLFEIW
jgi:small subunit ribosomal protein S8